MNCANGSCSLKKSGLNGLNGLNSMNGLMNQQPQLFNMNGASFQRFGNNSFNRLQQFNNGFRMF
jgi:hypothetical protein